MATGAGIPNTDAHQRQKIRCHDERAQIDAVNGRNIQHPGCGIAQEQGNEVEERVIHEIQNDGKVTFRRHQIQHAGTQHHRQRLTHAGGHHDGNDAVHGGRQVAEDPISHILQAEGLLFPIQILRNGSFLPHARRGAYHGIQLLHIGADDDLVLVSQPLGPNHAADGFDLVILHQSLVLHGNPEPGNAVRQLSKIFLAANQRKNLAGHFFVVFLCHTSFSFMWFLYCSPA